MNQFKYCKYCHKKFFKKCRQIEWENKQFCCSECWNHRMETPFYKELMLQKLISQTVITKSGCMEWSGYLNQKGYGVIHAFGKHYFTHRLMWILKNGKISNGKLICHICDNPPCINYKHLFKGTHLDNNKDMILKGRQNNQRTLTNNHVQKILTMAKEGILYKDIAKEFSITVSWTNRIATQNGIYRNKGW